MKEQHYTQHMGPILDQLLAEMGRTIDRESGQYKLLCRELLRASIRVTETNMGRLKDSCQEIDPGAVLEELGIENEPEPIPRLAEPAPDPSHPQQSAPCIALGTLIDEYQERQVQSKRWSEVTIRNHAPKLKALLQILGDRPVNTITIDDMRNYAKVLELLPPGFARLAKYKDLLGLTPDALIGKHKQRMDPTTRREYLNLAKSLFTYAFENQYIDSNPVISGIIPPKKKQARSQRDAFTMEDLNQIFNPDIYLKWSEGKPERFFIPLLLIFTGCRLEEVASLYREDVFQHEGLWCIDINNNNDRKIKNQNAARTVPLHPMIVERFRFPEYVQKVNHERVFPELTPSNFKYGHEFSKRFGYYLRNKAGIKTASKSLNSFRHTVTDYLFKKTVQESLIEELTGRAGKTETRRRYAKGYRIKTLYEECILKLDYEIDLSGLKD
ncbi:MAG: site-specific integrase [Desulfobacteraceae bacterium]|nr:MAG: site-specific integrase [Desulfobacteraceae bacterium]